MKDLLKQIRAAATGRGASMSKILILLVLGLPSHLVHGVPRNVCPRGSLPGSQVEGNVGYAPVPMIIPLGLEFERRERFLYGLDRGRSLVDFRGSVDVLQPGNDFTEGERYALC